MPVVLIPGRPCAPRTPLSITCRAKAAPSYVRKFSDVGTKILGCTVSLVLTAGCAWADADKFGEFAASGFIFKDTVDVIAFEDPEVKNVIIYLTEMQRSLSDKLAKDFFTDPSQASLACVVTGPPQISSMDKIRGRDGKEVLSQNRNFNLFQQKALRVRRLYDEKRNAIVYVAYSTRLNNATDEGAASIGRYNCIVKPTGSRAGAQGNADGLSGPVTSVCAVPLPDPATLQSASLGNAKEPVSA